MVQLPTIAVSNLSVELPGSIVITVVAIVIRAIIAVTVFIAIVAILCVTIPFNVRHQLIEHSLIASQVPGIICGLILTAFADVAIQASAVTADVGS